MTWKRILALLIDWSASILVVQTLPNGPEYGTQTHSFITLSIFATQVTLLTWLTGASFGQRIVGLKIKDFFIDKNPSFLQSLFRTFLIIIVFPPLLADAQGRGLHDRLAKTRIIKI